MVSIVQPSITLLLLTTAASVDASNAANVRQLRSETPVATYNQPAEYVPAMLARVNKERAAKGLPKVCTNNKLQAAAQRHVKDQSTTDYVSDTGRDGSTVGKRVTEAGYVWKTVAENVETEYRDVNSVVNWWMKNPVNCEKVLGNYAMVGTAYAFNKDSYYKHYWVQVYATGSTEECDADATSTANSPEQIVASEARAIVSVEQSAPNTPVLTKTQGEKPTGEDCD
ncbi:hypothetical protein PHYBOEH_006338 [Phytophthora boehmeriae]|uniref:SCP domain-containing protein n=1 Tax=Phytophthora boehmeriae TaxID=109152 RepID=A0A8T1WEJ8_9STRA|nr:hypothetical protein PHYBOEH_006338 [Phytophthora boehmeriae]